jgi:hypothetical protein
VALGTGFDKLDQLDKLDHQVPQASIEDRPRRETGT